MQELSERRIRRFWEMVEKHPGDGCWLWKGRLEANGYARTLVGSGPGREHWLCHRLAYRIANGSVAPRESGLVVMHSCDVRHCVRPDHLSQGTAHDNVMDAIAKGRSKPPTFSHPGESNGRAKLTQTQAESIRASTEHPRTLAGRHGVSVATIYYVKGGGWSAPAAMPAPGIEAMKPLQGE